MGPRKRCHDLLGFAAHHHVDPKLTKRRAGGDRAMWSDCNCPAATPLKNAQEPRRNAQLGWRTAPEQIAGCRCHNRHGGTEVSYLSGEILIITSEQMSVEHQHGVIVPLQHRLRVTKLKRQMRLTAAEVD